MKRRIEPFWWSLFGAGGVTSAMFFPALLIFFCLAVPLGFISAPSYAYLKTLFDPLIVRIILGGIIGLSFFHWAHRFRFTLYEGLQLHHYNLPIAVLCYGSAVMMNIFLAYMMFIY